MTQQAELLSAPVTVPAGYIGLSTSDIANAPASIAHSTVRTWDYRGTLGSSRRCVMRNLNTSSGVYNWDSLDQLCTSNSDKRLIVTLGAPPDYMISRAAIGGSYLGGKSNMCPDDLTAWGVAVTAMATRLRDTHGRTGVIYELWNEIDQTSVYADPMSLLGPYTKATVQAIRAVDPSAVILSPSLAGHDAASTLQAALGVSDGAGGVLSDWLDGACWHYYTQSDHVYEHPINYVQAVSAIRAACVASGVDFPIWCTESGFQSTAPNIGIRYPQRMIVFAALGVRHFLGYTYDDASFPVSPYETEWNSAANILTGGAVISSCVVGLSSVSAVINGSTYEF